MPLSPSEDHSKNTEMRHYLKEPPVQADLQNRLANVQESVTTSIHDAAMVVGMTEAQLRYSEAKGLLSPKRTLEAPLDADSHRGQRRYSLPELRRLVVIGKLLEIYSPTDVALFIESHETALQDVIELRQTPLFERVFIAEQTVFQRFLVPRLLYTAISLLLENVIDGEAGVYIPVRGAVSELEHLKHVAVADGAQLDTLGRSLIGWHSHGRPFSAFLNERPFLDTPTNFFVKPLTSLLGGAEPMRGAQHPVGVHLAFERILEPTLTLAGSAADERLSAALRSQQGASLDAGRPAADPRAVAARLLWLTQQTPDDQSPQSLARAQGDRPGEATDGDFSQRYMQYALRQRNTGLAPYPALWRGISASSDSMVYSAPEFSDPLLGDSLLAYLAESIVQLGGYNDAGARRWRFACILEPRDRTAPRHEHNLVVRSQSARSPYKPGGAHAPSIPRSSISTHAYQSGVSVYRRMLVEGDQALAFDNVEHARSALAMPLEGTDGAVVGVLYVVSDDADAFDQNDHLLVRIMGRFIGELLIAYRTRNLSRETITTLITAPETITPIREIPSENDFTRDLERQLSPAVSPANPLSLIAVDINDQGQVVASYGEEISRLLSLEVGRRIIEQSRLQFNQTEQLRHYRIYADRFYILFRDVALVDVQNFAYQLREALGGSYHIRGGVTIERVGVRVAAVTYDVSALLSPGGEPTSRTDAPDAALRRVSVARANITRTLDEALILAKHTNTKNIITWDAAQRRLIEWSPTPTTPQIAADLLTRLANAPEDSQEALVYKMLTNLMGKSQQRA